MNLNLYNTAHPMAEGGRPIFVPFGEWPYDRARRQRLDRAHGEAIANELNARVARGEPGIPVYQGHPDVPELAARYPDKGAIGWVTRIDLANEGGRDGLALTVEWDRDPGRGFRWFSPYWTASAAPDGVCAVEAILSVGLVNNPNIPDFRLANERTNMKTDTLPRILVELAARRDAALANEANYDESKHPRAEDGKWTSGGGSGGSGGHKPRTDGFRDSPQETAKKAQFLASRVAELGAKTRADRADIINHQLRNSRGDVKSKSFDIKSGGYNSVRAAHKAAIILGLSYNRSTHQYE